MTERFIVDDAGTLIDMQTRDMFDIVEEVVDLLNALNDENEQLKAKIKREIGHNQRLHQDNVELHEENEQLRKELTDCEKFRHTVFKTLNKVMTDDK